MPIVRILIALWLASVATVARAEAPADSPRDVLVQALPKIVKLHGAGGYGGLESYGSGFLISGDGLIATSWSTLLDAEPITAVLDDGRRFRAELVGVDTTFGLALLKIDAQVDNLPHFDLENAGRAALGDRVFVLSNMFRVAAGDEPVSVMHGSVIGHTRLEARRGRHEFSLPVPVYIVDVVSNNPGAAGGAIISLDGKLLGMIGREIRSTNTETWINYSLPAHAVRERLNLIIDGSVPPGEDRMAEEPSETRRPVELGLVLIPNVTARTPAYITDVLEESPGKTSGFQRDDLVVFAGGKPVRSIDEFVQQLSRAEPGDRLTIVVRRDGSLETLALDVP